MIPTDEIIKMARQCGMSRDKYGLFHNIEESEDGADLESFANLVSARAAAIERESCAKVCDELGDGSQKAGDTSAAICADELASAIRARGDGT